MTTDLSPIQSAQKSGACYRGLSAVYPTWPLLLPRTRAILAKLDGWDQMAVTSTARSRRTPRPCAWLPCSREFTPKRPHQRFHVPACQIEAHKAAKRERYHAEHIPRKHIRLMDARKIKAIHRESQ